MNFRFPGRGGRSRGGKWGGRGDMRGTNRNFNNVKGAGKFGSQLRKLKWDLTTLQPFRKNFYIPHVAVIHRSLDEVLEYRKTREVTVKVNIVILFQKQLYKKF